MARKAKIGHQRDRSYILFLQSPVKLRKILLSK